MKKLTKPADYIDSLSHLADPPESLYYKGDLSLLKTKRQNMIAIVGTRKPTKYGATIVKEVCAALSETEAVVVSGLAYGIDSLAHKNSLNHQLPNIAVLAGGLSKIYPANHTELAAQIVSQGGLLLSELPPHSSPRKFHFLARNRLIAALVDTIIVPEAAERSGTMSTVRHALDLGRQIIAAPGRLHDLQSKGANQYIAAGAEPLIDISGLSTRLGLKTKKGSNDAVDLVLSFMKKPISAPELARLTAIEETELEMLLLQIEISGKAANRADGKWSLIKN